MEMDSFKWTLTPIIINQFGTISIDGVLMELEGFKKEPLLFINTVYG